ncbi:aminoglycoside 6-adenylyltransferase [Bacillus andreraoultii]|uniref:aminoglycoside 6-adenylyltransferase n=1 Tax=Caldifermentibacillus hisashii TaxID=996558 RepID=UPI00053AFD52
MGVAEQDEQIHAVEMNGSRTNLNVPKDIVQDFDIVYLVTEMDSFINDTNWVNVFGKRMIVQTPKRM